MSSNKHYTSFPNLAQYNIVKAQPFIIQPAPPRFKATRGGTVRLDEIASIAGGLAQVADNPDVLRGVIAMAAALGVEVV